MAPRRPPRCGRSPSRCALLNPSGVEGAGFGTGPDAADRLFDAIVDSPSGVVITEDDQDATWRRVATPDGKVQLAMPELLAELDELGDPPGSSAEWPFLLSAGERRSFTANTIFRDPAWRKRAGQEALRVATVDAERLGLTDGDRVRIVTERGEATIEVAVDDRDAPRPPRPAQRHRHRPPRRRRARASTASPRTS